MEPLLIFPDPAPPELVQVLDLGGYHWQAVTGAHLNPAAQPANGWSGAIIAIDSNPDGAFAMCRALRKQNEPLSPIMLLVSGLQLDELESRSELFDEFCMSPFHPRELEARLKHMFARAGVSADRPDLVEYGPLALNTETYQAVIGEEPLDLTYMEYELLKFLASNPGKVFTRATLLSRVWGYDYFGGARTVDVHVRRLRSKLGDDHASLIQTIRSVGYSFGESRWNG